MPFGVAGGNMPGLQDKVIAGVAEDGIFIAGGAQQRVGDTCKDDLPVRRPVMALRQQGDHFAPDKLRQVVRRPLHRRPAVVDMVEMHHPLIAVLRLKDPVHLLIQKLSYCYHLNKEADLRLRHPVNITSHELPETGVPDVGMRSDIEHEPVDS